MTAEIIPFRGERRKKKRGNLPMPEEYWGYVTHYFKIPRHEDASRYIAEMVQDTVEQSGEPSPDRMYGCGLVEEEAEA